MKFKVHRTQKNELFITIDKLEFTRLVERAVLKFMPKYVFLYFASLASYYGKSLYEIRINLLEAAVLTWFILSYFFYFYEL